MRLLCLMNGRRGCSSPWAPAVAGPQQTDAYPARPRVVERLGAIPVELDLHAAVFVQVDLADKGRRRQGPHMQPQGGRLGSTRL